METSKIPPAPFIPLNLVLDPVGLRVKVSRSDMVVGRHSQADIRLTLPDVSRRHCRLLFEAGQWRVVDLNSANGTFVNGERISQANLYDGDRLQLGNFCFRVEHGATVPLFSEGTEKRLAS